LSTNQTSPPVKWAAQLASVQEVSLVGTASLAFWKERLRAEDLVPLERAGRAQVLVTAAAARFWGVRFQEVSFSVLVSDSAGGGRREGAYLLGAFNSSRFFAFCERALFATPYYPADVRVTAAGTASVEVRKRGEVVFRAAMSDDGSAATRAVLRQGEDGWEGPVFLPKGKLFFARIKGHTQAYPFLPDRDALTVRPTQNDGFLQALIDSEFAVNEWTVRADATHAKSKTYQREAKPAHE
jgi:hypothetical protein